jgi:hypothetical protein
VHKILAFDSNLRANLDFAQSIFKDSSLVMARKLGIDEFKRRLERLRQDSATILSNTQVFVSEAVNQIAGSEMKALSGYRKSALDAVKKGRSKGDELKHSAQHQLDQVHETVGQIVAHARESLGLISDARSKLSRKNQQSARRPAAGTKVAKAPAAKKTSSAPRKAVKPAAAPVVAKAETPAPKRKSAVALVNTAGKIREATAYHVGSVLDLTLPNVPLRRLMPIKPSPDSRAGRATSKGKRAALSAAKAAAVSDAAETPTDTTRPPV